MASNVKGRTTLEVGADGVALITIINPPVNSLSFDGMIFCYSYSPSMRCDFTRFIYFDL